MVEWGARHVALLGRRGASSRQAREAIASLRAVGVRVLVLQADVARADQLARALDRAARRLPPLRGVLHAAGVLADAPLLDLDRPRMDDVLAPKLRGSWNLHLLTRAAALDFFVVFSSAVTALGSTGQAAYVAANEFLDALARHRRALGLPALSVGFGPWADVGLAAREGRGDRLARHGLRSLPPARALDALGRLLASGAEQATVMDLDAGEWTRSFPEHAAIPRLSVLLGRPGTVPAGCGLMRRSLLVTSLGAPRREALEAHVREEIARVLRLEPDRIDARQPLSDLGLDSLMALELRNRFQDSLGAPLSATLLFAQPTLQDLVPYLAQRAGIPLEVQEYDVDVAQPGRFEQDPALVVAREIDPLSEREVLRTLVLSPRDVGRGRG
jgi:acyl carrier protein